MTLHKNFALIFEHWNLLSANVTRRLTWMKFLQITAERYLVLLALSQSYLTLIYSFGNNRATLEFGAEFPQQQIQLKKLFPGFLKTK